jgi:YVTN family beta-propeller protein
MRMLVLLTAVLPCIAGLPQQSDKRPGLPHRSPCDLVVLPDGRRALTANHTADSVSLVDVLAGKVLAEAPCGRKPTAVACSADGRLAAVTNLWSSTVTLFAIEGESIRGLGEVEVGPQPRGLVFTADGLVFVAVGGADQLAAIGVRSLRVVHRLPGPRDPWAVAVSPNGKFLAAAGSRWGGVRLWDLDSRKMLWDRTIEDAFNLRGLNFTVDGAAIVCAHVVKRDFPVSRANIEQGWVTDSRLTRLPVGADTVPTQEQLALDTRGRAVGDPHGVAFEPAGRTLAVTASGTHEMLLFATPGLPWNGGDPGDVIDADLLKDVNRFQRVPLGGRPMGLAFLPSGRQVAVANYLLDAVQVVDIGRAELVRTIALGGPTTASPARQGEAFFYDAGRSHNQWFSCHTCHTDGHTCGRSFDTLNDESYGNPKLTPSLRGVTHTGPWTWHGWQKDLGAAVKKSSTETMFGPAPSSEEVKAVVAFLGTLDFPPNPHRGPRGDLTAAARRGAGLFAGKARCERCHKPDEYTAERNYDVKLEADGSPFTLWNPPSLRGLWDRGPFLHDGRASSLEELLVGPHAPEKLSGEALTPAEHQDLIAFLRSL